MKARLSVLVVGSAVGAYLGIRAHEQANHTTEEPKIVTEPPVEAPKGLVAEAIIAAPDATWKKAQTAIGGFILAAQPLALWPLAALACLGAGAGALSLESHLPRELRLTPA